MRIISNNKNGNLQKKKGGMNLSEYLFIKVSPPFKGGSPPPPPSTLFMIYSLSKAKACFLISPSCSDCRASSSLINFNPNLHDLNHLFRNILYF